MHSEYLFSGCMRKGIIIKTPSAVRKKLGAATGQLILGLISGLHQCIDSTSIPIWQALHCI